MIRKTRFVIAVPDLERSMRFYRDVLGFQVLDIDAPGWGFFVRDAAFIMAGECRDAIDPHALGDHSYFAYLEVDEIDDLYASVTAQGTNVVKKIQNEPWGMREFGIRTVDGHRLMFASPTLTVGL